MRHETNIKSGRVYAIQCGAEEFVIVQFGVLKVDTIRVFEDTMSADSIKRLKDIVARTLPEQKVLLQLQLDRAAERRGKWVYLGKFPLHPEINSRVEYLRTVTRGTPDGGLTYEYIAYSHDNPYGRKISREESIGLEYELTPGENVLWRWICRSKPVPLDERSPLIYQQHLKAIWKDEARRRYLEWAMPGFLEHEVKRLGLMLE